MKLFQRPLAQFQIKVKTHWNTKSEQVRMFDIHDDDDDEQEHGGEEEMIEQDDEN